MDPALRRALELLEAAAAGPSIPGYAPPAKQLFAQGLADDSEVFELLYGGAAGGGKSYWLRHDAVASA